MRNKILIVDDVEINRELLAEMLKDEYEILMAKNGLEALEILEQCHDDIAALLLDLVMPKMDGFTVLEILNTKSWGSQLAIMIISGDTAVQTEKRCFALGVADFVHRPFNSGLVKKRVDNVVSLFQYRAELEQKVEQQTEALKNQNELLRAQAEQLRASRERVIDILGTVVEYRNLESGEHIKRVKAYTRILAEALMHEYPEYKLTDRKIEVIVSASALHDIGKIAIPDSILTKPARLTNEEFEEMKTHTAKGGEIIKNIKDVWSKDFGKVCYEICRYHHERFNGKGYPDGLKGDEIPISAQLVSIADVYDALVNERVYKKAFSKDEAFRMITNDECGVFSPKLMDCFRKLRGAFESLADA